MISYYSPMQFAASWRAAAWLGGRTYHDMSVARSPPSMATGSTLHDNAASSSSAQPVDLSAHPPPHHQALSNDARASLGGLSNREFEQRLSNARAHLSNEEFQRLSNELSHKHLGNHGISHYNKLSNKHIRSDSQNHLLSNQHTHPRNETHSRSNELNSSGRHSGSPAYRTSNERTRDRKQSDSLSEPAGKRQKLSSRRRSNGECCLFYFSYVYTKYDPDVLSLVRFGVNQMILMYRMVSVTCFDFFLSKKQGPDVSALVRVGMICSRITLKKTNLYFKATPLSLQKLVVNIIQTTFALFTNV